MLRLVARLLNNPHPEVIEHIKFWFRIFGIWVLAAAVFVIAISATGFRKGADDHE
jgi:hypothetical protein